MLHFCLYITRKKINKSVYVKLENCQRIGEKQKLKKNQEISLQIINKNINKKIFLYYKR